MLIRITISCIKKQGIYFYKYEYIFIKIIALGGIYEIYYIKWSFENCSFLIHIGITKCQLYSIFSYKLFFYIQLKLKERDRFIKHIGMTK